MRSKGLAFAPVGSALGPGCNGALMQTVSAWAAALLSLVLVVQSCGGKTLAPAVPDKPPEAARTEQAHLLLFPVEDGEALLGREVKLTPDGAWTIAASRAPGCEVRVKHQKSEYAVRRLVDVESLTTLSAGFARLVSLEGRFGRANKADIDIQNSEILQAEARGLCGGVIVDTVFLGRGKRKLMASAEARGGVSAQMGALNPGIAHDARREVVDETSWQSNQAYGFSYRKLDQTKPLDLEVAMPLEVVEGEAVRIKITTTSPAYLVAYYIDADGRGDVLWPSNEEPAPVAAPDKPAFLPSERERSHGVAIRAAVKTAGTPSREMLAVYAFSEKADFVRLAPGSSGNSADGAAYAAELTQKLDGVPLHRWSRAIVSYRILPKGK